MSPYFQTDLITLYCGDCNDILDDIDKAGTLLLADPPHGINLDTSQAKYFRDDVTYRPVHGDTEPFNPRALLDFERIILWGANAYSSKLPDFPGWLSWVKINQNNTRIRQSETEFAYTNFVKRSMAFRYTWIGAGKEEREFNGRGMLHPNQKPRALMRWCIEQAQKVKPVLLVLDPYTGSGTTLLAATELGIPSIGIEIDAEYCRIAAARIESASTRKAVQLFDKFL